MMAKCKKTTVWGEADHYLKPTHITQTAVIGPARASLCGNLFDREGNQRKWNTSSWICLVPMRTKYLVLYKRKGIFLVLPFFGFSYLLESVVWSTFACLHFKWLLCWARSAHKMKMNLSVWSGNGELCLRVFFVKGDANKDRFFSFLQRRQRLSD